MLSGQTNMFIDPGIEAEDPTIGPAGRLQRYSHRAMATIVEIACVHPDPLYGEQAARAAFDLIDRIESELTCHREGGDISRINRLQAGESARVGHWTMECLQLAGLFHHLTGGAFDISLGSGMESVELVPGESLVRIHAAGVRLDLGGIGKGYAVDRAGELLEDWEVPCSLTHAGCSSVLALDPPPGSGGWPLTISLPGADRAPVLARFSVQRQAWSASGARKPDHIVDPRNGRPVRDRVAAWVSGSLDSLNAVCRGASCDQGRPPEAGACEIAASPAAAAEALSTAFMILPLDEIAAFCRRHPGVEARILPAAPGRSSFAQALVHFGG